VKAINWTLNRTVSDSHISDKLKHKSLIMSAAFKLWLFLNITKFL
jgi:hypothetical protein